MILKGLIFTILGNQKNKIEFFFCLCTGKECIIRYNISLPWILSCIMYRKRLRVLILKGLNAILSPEFSERAIKHRYYRHLNSIFSINDGPEYGSNPLTINGWGNLFSKCLTFSPVSLMMFREKTAKYLTNC